MGKNLVFCNSNGKLSSIDELEEIGENIAQMIMKTFPESEGKVDLYPAESDPWDSFQIVFNKSRIISKDLSPNIETIKMRQSLRDHIPVPEIRGEAVCDLNKGEIYGLQLGDFVERKPQGNSQS